MASPPKVPGRSEQAVLFVDDDPDQLILYEHLFARAGVVVLTAESGLHALDILRDRSVCLVVSDYTMPGMTGVMLLSVVARLYPDTGRILLTGEVDSDIVIEAKDHKVLTKGMDSALIQRSIEREIRRHDR